jgi:hypothetical protein
MDLSNVTAAAGVSANAMSDYNTCSHKAIESGPVTWAITAGLAYFVYAMFFKGK